MSIISYKKRFLVSLIAAILLVAPFLAQAVNDLTINGVVSFSLITADTAVPATITASTGGQATLIDIQSNYIDITLDNLSTVTFNTIAPGRYLRISYQSGSTDYTIAPACPTTIATLTGTGAQVVLRLEVYATNSCPPGPGGGGHTPVFPTNYSISINNGATTTGTTSVTLNLKAQNAVQVLISNDANFLGANWQSFTNPLDLPWTLTAGDGTKTVYVIYKSPDGNLSPTLSDSIVLQTGIIVPPVIPPVVPPIVPPVVPPIPPTQIITPLSGLHFGELIKSLSISTVYYYGNDGRRYIFPNEATFFTWYSDFTQVVIISDADLAKIELGRIITYRPGVKMLKSQSMPDVYAIDSHGTLRWIVSEQVATDLYGPNWSKMVDDLSDAFYLSYQLGPPIRSAADFVPSLTTEAAIDINTDMQINLI